MAATKTFKWTVTYTPVGAGPAETIDAAYYRLDEHGWGIEFKDTENQIVFTVCKELVQSIRRGIEK